MKNTFVTRFFLGFIFLNCQLAFSQASAPADLELRAQQSVVNANGIHAFYAENVKIYLLNRTLFIQFNNGSDSTGEIKLFSISGEEILSKEVNEPNHRIDLSDLEKGLYLIRIQCDNDHTIIKKLVID